MASLIAADQAASFLGSNKYGIAFAVGVGALGFSALFAKMILPKPNDNFTYIFFGTGYVNPDATWRQQEEQVKAGTAGVFTAASHELDHWFATTPELQKNPATGALGYHIGDKWYSREDMWSQIKDGQTPQWATSDIDVAALRTQLGNLYTKPDGTLTSNSEEAARAQNTIALTPAMAAKHPLRLGKTLTLSDKEFVAAHEDGFRAVYGDKELTRQDVRQYFVMKSGAVVANNLEGEQRGKGARVQTEDWLKLNPAQREKWEQQKEQQAKIFASSPLGRGVVTVGVDGKKVPGPNATPGAKKANVTKR